MKKENKINIILRVVIFLLIGLMLIHIVTKIFIPKWNNPIDPATSRIKGFYQEEKDSIDVLYLGNSDVGRGYSPITVWDLYGITSYNLGTSNQTLDLSYYLLKEALNYQKPKVVILDMDGIYAEKKAPEGEYRKLFDNMKFGKIKLEAINDKNLEIENKDKISYIFPILRFHSRWNELDTGDFRKIKNGYFKKLSYKGMAISLKVKPYIDKEKYMEEKKEKVTIPDGNLEYLQKIVKLCEDNGIKMLWTELPTSRSHSLAKNKKTTELANTYGIKFIDYNLKKNFDEIKMNWNNDTADGGFHLNVNGAEKVSKNIGKLLSEEYSCLNHKGQSKYINWQKESEAYHRHIKK